MWDLLGSPCLYLIKSLVRKGKIREHLMEPLPVDAQLNLCCSSRSCWSKGRPGTTDASLSQGCRVFISGKEEDGLPSDSSRRLPSGNPRRAGKRWQSRINNAIQEYFHRTIWLAEAARRLSQERYLWSPSPSVWKLHSLRKWKPWFICRGCAVRTTRASLKIHSQ